MEYGFTASKVRHLHLLTDTWLQHEQTMDLIVPDNSPDAVCIADSFGVVYVRSRECGNGTVLISGGIQAGVLYQAEGETTLRLVETYCPFTLRRELAGCDENDIMFYQCRLTTCDARILNSRKILLRMEIGCSVQVYQKQDLSVCVAPTEDADLQLLTNKKTLKLFQDSGEKSFSLEESFDLPGGYVPIEQLLRTSVQTKIHESRVAGSKAIFKGTVGLELLYRSVEQNLEHWQLQIPFSQYCELESDWDEADVVLSLELAGCDVQTDDASSVSIRVMLNALGLVLRQQEVVTIEDAYHLKGPLDAQIRRESCSHVQEQKTVSLPIQARTNRPYAVILDTQVLYGRPEISGTAVKLPITVKLTGLDANDQFLSDSVKTEAILENMAEPDVVPRLDAMHTNEVYAIPGSNGAEVRVTAQLRLTHCRCWQNTVYEHICVTEEPEAFQNRPSVIMRTVPEACSVWQLAKEAATTCDLIRSANRIQEDTVAAGTLILIPLR